MTIRLRSGKQSCAQERRHLPSFNSAAASDKIRWMLRDERLQKVVADIDSAPDRERVRDEAGDVHDGLQLVVVKLFEM